VCDVREPRDLKFAGRIVRQNYLPATVDRLGSVVTNQQASLYGSVPTKNFAPFGEQLNAAQAPNVFPGNTGFATYWGDSSTGLDYANQRFYSANYARFMSADQSKHSKIVYNLSGNLNLYSYAGSDPINRIDPLGTDFCGIGSCNVDPPSCFGDPFAPVADPGCEPVIGPQPNPPTRGELKPIQCEILLFNQSAGFEGNVAQHTFLEVYSFDPNTGSETNAYLEAGPSNLKDAMLGTATLDKSNDISQPMYNTFQSVTFDFYKSTDLCSREKQLNRLLTATRTVW